jgi:hypothetical protein
MYISIRGRQYSINALDSFSRGTAFYHWLTQNLIWLKVQLPCSVKDSYKWSDRPEGEGITILRRVCKYITVYKTSHLKQLLSSEAPLWEHQTSRNLTDVCMALVSLSRRISWQNFSRSRTFHSTSFVRHCSFFFLSLSVIQCDILIVLKRN